MLKFNRENVMDSQIQGFGRKQVDRVFTLNKQAGTTFK